MADGIKPGDRINITIEHARARLVRSEDGSGVDWLSYDVGGYVTSLPLVDEVTVEHGDPEWWPPRAGDLLRMSSGTRLFAMAHGSNITLTSSRGHTLTPEQAWEQRHLLELVNREDEPGGGAR
ncbi:hypothetical protein [Actinomadura geliboluensis]|uniref:hypothetical protein n=1 Tax=Actinomadura geliboluensis TaxID=882440 RepID=UPI0036BF4AAB